MGKPKGTEYQGGGSSAVSLSKPPCLQSSPSPSSFLWVSPTPLSLLSLPSLAVRCSLPTPRQGCGGWRLEAGAGGWRPELGRGLRGRWELAAVLSCCWSEGGQVTDLPAGVTQETPNYMLVTATLDHFNHAAAMSEMLSLGIKENKQAEAAVAAAAALSSDCLVPRGAVAVPALAGPAVRKV